MRYIIALLAITIACTNSFAGTCDNINKVPICHKGAGNSHDKYVNICVDFGALWGHIAQHPDDYVGECTVDIEANLKVWACNAGLRHKDHLDKKCFDMNNGGVEVTSCQGLSNCLCSGEALPQVLNEFDFFSFNIANYSLGAQTSSYISTDKRAGRESFTQASSAQGTQILAKETGVTFSLGSERFGSEYFVDLCWEVLDENLREIPLKMEAEILLKSDLFNTGSGYLSSALVSQRNGVFCDKTTESGPYSYSSSPVFTTDNIPFLAGIRTFETIVEDARSCFVRMIFKENQNSILRPWDLKHVTVEPTITVEPVDPLPPLDTGLRFCHVDVIRGSSATCRQLDFVNTDDLRTYMTTGYSNIPDWNQDHNKDYRGTCEVLGPCSAN